MQELNNDTMQEYLRLGLVEVYSENIVLRDGLFATLIEEFVDGKSYEVQLVSDERYKESPFVQVIMMNGKPRIGFTGWEYFLAKKVDETLLA